MNKSSPATGSLDMLLDTMCNTFGGVCFIALLIAIISSALPKNNSDGEETAQSDVDRMVVDRETDRLQHERDELLAAIATQESIISTNNAGKTLLKSQAAYVSSISSNVTVIGKLKREKENLEADIARLAAASRSNRAEMERLQRVLKALEGKTDKAANVKKRAVRMPRERQIQGLTSEDLWLKNGNLYVLHDETQVKTVTTRTYQGVSWDYTPIPGAGYKVVGSFFSSASWDTVKSRITSKDFVRIYADTESFEQLCGLRDALISLRKMYNWYYNAENTLHFVEGYDGYVQ